MYTFYFEVINTLWSAKFKLYATDSMMELGRDYQQHEIETLIRAGGRVMLEPSKFVRREEPKLRVAPGYFEPKPVTLESVSKFTDRVMKALALDDPAQWQGIGDTSEDELWEPRANQKKS